MKKTLPMGALLHSPLPVLATPAPARCKWVAIFGRETGQSRSPASPVESRLGQILLRACLLPLCLASGAAASREVLVRVEDLRGLPVQNVVVQAVHPSGARAHSCQTDDSGTCRLLLASSVLLLTVRTEDLEGELHWNASDPAQTAVLKVQPTALRTVISVVSGSRVEELQEESVTKVDAVTRQQMLSTGYERVSDVLQEIPGVLVRRGSTATVGGEQIQGVDSRQVLVLQDGLPVVGARGIKAGAINLNRQSSDRLGRIEVAKGSGSSLYGSDAIGGVINMITREPTAPLQGGFTLSGGTLGMFDGRGDIGGRRGPTSFFLNLGQHHLESYRLIPNSVTTVGPEVRRQDLLFKTRYQFRPELALGFTANAYRNRDRGQNMSETGPVDGVTHDSMQSYALVADWTVNSSTVWQARAYAARYDENNLTTPIGRPGPPSPANLNERLGRLDSTISSQVGRNHFLQGGVEWAQTLYRGANRLAGDHVGQRVTATDTWLQDKWQIHPRMTLTAGGRITAHSLFGAAAVPKAGLIVRLSDSWILRGSFGLGFRAPDLGQLYFRFANPASFYQVIGNPNLRPEHSQSFQTGLLYRQRNYRLGLTLFRNNIRDLIDSRLVGTPRTPAELNALLVANGIPAFFDPLLNRQTFVYFNQARIFTQGVELDGEYAFSRQLRISGAYTFLNALDRQTRLALPQRHRHQGMVRADYFIRPLGVSANVRGTFFSHWMLNPALGTRGLPYQIWDAYLAKDFRRGFQSFLSVDNFANSRDGKLNLPTPTFDRPDYGRMFRVGLRYRFGGKE